MSFWDQPRCLYDPLTAVVIGGAALKAVGGFQASRFQQKTARANAEFAETLGERNALAEENRAEAEEVRLRRTQERRLGATRAAFGAAGVQIEGTPLQVLADERAEFEENALLVRFEGEEAAKEARFRGDIEAREQRTREKVFRQEATASLLSGATSAGTSLLA